MSDIVGRLRNRAFRIAIGASLAKEAAARIEQLERENAELASARSQARREALEEAAKVAELLHSHPLVSLDRDEEGNRSEKEVARGGPGADIAAAIRRLAEQEGTGK